MSHGNMTMEQAKELQRRYNNTKRYRVLWNTLKQRCRKKGYVFDERFNIFEDFLFWCQNQIGYNCLDLSGNSYECETDLLSKGCKSYSPDTILFVPKSVNQLCLTKRKKRGVQYLEGKNKPYRAYLGKFGKSVHLGYFESEEEAYSVVCAERVKYIDELKDLYGDTVDERVWLELKDVKWFGKD